MVLLLLGYYLLVVGAGLVGRPEPVRPAGTPYVHSTTCQHENYLRLDCFDRCNNDAQTVQKHAPGDTWQHLLTTLKSLDVHCSFDAAPTVPAPLPQFARVFYTSTTPALAAGACARLDLPPRLS
ncbi:hypothetical protein GCM10023186_11610 [Hymenobacter koreensis]|uniref:Secreted protein n=1 Tax=Hymenobacter koreensis TaxID=1084523 RepID=A0ABP8IWH8_9BACT